VDPPLHSRKQTSEYAEETSNTVSQKVKNSSISKKSDVDNFWGCTRANFETLPKEVKTVNSVSYSEALQDQLKPAI
jgi:hypothetical protein